MKRFKRVRIWLWAHFDTHRLWRVTYKTGEKTRLLRKEEAHNLAEIFTGTAWIDYEYGYMILSR